MRVGLIITKEDSKCFQEVEAYKFNTNESFSSFPTHAFHMTLCVYIGGTFGELKLTSEAENFVLLRRDCGNSRVTRNVSSKKTYKFMTFSFGRFLERGHQSSLSSIVALHFSHCLFSHLFVSQSEDVSLLNCTAHWEINIVFHALWKLKQLNWVCCLLASPITYSPSSSPLSLAKHYEKRRLIRTESVSNSCKYFFSEMFFWLSRVFLSAGCGCELKSLKLRKASSREKNNQHHHKTFIFSSIFMSLVLKKNTK